jgi:hypothetical protein
MRQQQKKKLKKKDPRISENANVAICQWGFREYWRISDVVNIGSTDMMLANVLRVICSYASNVFPKFCHVAQDIKKSHQRSQCLNGLPVQTSTNCSKT